MIIHNVPSCIGYSLPIYMIANTKRPDQATEAIISNNRIRGRLIFYLFLRNGKKGFEAKQSPIYNHDDHYFAPS